MDAVLISIDYRDPAWIAIAFLCGLACRQIKLPPMVGFLVAGFALNFLGAESDRFLEAVANLGVTLLLFTIGLKLRLGTLLRPEIWATTVLHMGATIGIVCLCLILLSIAGVLLFADLDVTTALIVAFALSFSSTVFAVKTLEDRGAMVSRYGQIGIGILVMQDIAAVIFLAASAGKLPSIWAITLLALIPGRYVLGYLMSKCGHTELLTVFGFVIALGGAAVFELVGMKGDLGALILGVLLSYHPKAKELSKTLLGFKDVFLVCFFLTIGLTGLPDWEATGTALLLLVLLPFKIALFFYLLCRFRLRARSATLTSLLLGNYSEFGLIVGSIAIGAGWLDPQWLTVIALALAISFVIAAPLNVLGDAIYARFQEPLQRFETRNRLPGDDTIQIGGSRILIFGMGRVGRAAYDEMAAHVDNKILGVDLDEAQVAVNLEAGRQVVMGDATHPEFWSRLDDGHDGVQMILLAMPNHKSNMDAADQLRARGYQGPIVATAFYPDQEEELREHGIDAVFNIYAQAGSGAAARMWGVLEGRGFEGNIPKGRPTE